MTNWNEAEMPGAAREILKHLKKKFWIKKIFSIFSAYVKKCQPI